MIVLRRVRKCNRNREEQPQHILCSSCCLTALSGTTRLQTYHYPQSVPFHLFSNHQVVTHGVKAEDPWALPIPGVSTSTGSPTVGSQATRALRLSSNYRYSRYLAIASPLPIQRLPNCLSSGLPNCHGHSHCSGTPRSRAVAIHSPTRRLPTPPSASPKFCRLTRALTFLTHHFRRQPTNQLSATPNTHPKLLLQGPLGLVQLGVVYFHDILLVPSTPSLVVFWPFRNLISSTHSVITSSLSSLSLSLSSHG